MPVLVCIVTFYMSGYRQQSMGGKVRVVKYGWQSINHKI